MSTIEDFLNGDFAPEPKLEFEETAAFTFHIGEKQIPVLEFMYDGTVKVRGEVVESNYYVYEAMCDFLEEGGYLDNWKRP